MATGALSGGTGSIRKSGSTKLLLTSHKMLTQLSENVVRCINELCDAKNSQYPEKFQACVSLLSQLLQSTDKIHPLY